MDVNTLKELLASQFGLRTTYNINPVTTSVGVTLTKILAANPNRLGVSIFNMGASVIYLSPSNAVAVGNGVLLQANGGGISLNWHEDFELVGMAWNAVADGASSDIYIIETVTY